MAMADGRGEGFDGGITLGRNRACGAADNSTPARSGKDSTSPLFLRDDPLGEDAQSMDVRGRRNATPDELFWRGIAGRSDANRLAVLQRGIGLDACQRRTFRQPQIDDDRFAVRTKKDVARL